jgi:hypothetical protein
MKPKKGSATLLGILALASALAACSGGSSAASSAGSSERSTVSSTAVTCDKIILTDKHPFHEGTRRVLGVIAAPPAYISQVIRHPGEQWPYGEKAGLGVRAGSGPITITVPTPWRSRVAIAWGDFTQSASSVQIAACPPPANVWNIYAGGFSLRHRSECFPLIFSVGHQSGTVWFGLGRRCASNRSAADAARGRPRH